MHAVRASTARVLIAAGLACLAWAAGHWVYGSLYQASVRASFADVPPDAPAAPAPGPAIEAPRAGMPIGLLEIPRLSMSVAVVEGDDEDALDVGAGHLPDTPLPWREGNAALAAHRDTFFRPLRRVRIGDSLQLRTRRGLFRYRVSGIRIVDPRDVSVLRSPNVQLTLITCYPINFIGSAPKRYIVQAEPEPATARPVRTGDHVRRSRRPRAASKPPARNQGILRRAIAR
jgi:sortase A